MRLKHIIPAALAALAITSACDEGNSPVGPGLVQDQVVIDVDSSFTITGSSERNAFVPSRTTTQLLGSIDAPEFGRVSSDFVTQFMPSSILVTDGMTAADVDSLMLVMSVAKGNFIGDSIVPMGLEVYPLTRLLPSPIYSNFNPDGYYDPTPLATSMYNLAFESVDTVVNANYRQIRVKLPIELGRKLFQEYVDNPGQFSSPTTFAEFFPGIYVKNSYGSGRISTITSTMMSMYYHRNVKNEAGRDTTIKGVGNYFAVTREIITNNNINVAVAASVSQRVADGEAILMAPTGYDLKLRFPAPEILAAFRSDASALKVVNGLSLSIPVEAIANDDNITVPPYVLLVLASKRDEFFAGNSLPDDKTQFLATYNAQTGTYDISSMRQYVQSLLEKETITADDYTFILTPVSTIYETANDYYGTQTLTAVTPYVSSPVMGRVLLDKAKIKFTFTSQEFGQ